MNKNIDMLILGACIICLLVFVYFLPQIDSNVRNSASNQEITPEKIPVTYYCEREVNNDFNAEVYQKATYTISDKSVVYAYIIRTYQFHTLDDYNNYKNSIVIENVEGIEVKNDFDEKSMLITETTTKDITKISPEDLDGNFPKTYDNLLIYTKGQKCKATY